MKPGSSKWFPHDADACDDPRIMLLITQHGWEGYGLYWMLLQKLCKQPEYRLPLFLLDSISRMNLASKEKLESIVTKFNLFEIDQDNSFYSPSLIKRMEPFEKRLIINKQNALKGWQSRKSNTDEGVAMAMRSQCDGNEENTTQHKHNITKEKKKERITESCDSDPSSLFSENILKLFTWILEGKLPFTKERVFPDKLLPKTEKQKKEWIQVLEKLNQKDGYSMHDINGAIIYAREDDFWKGNFQSLLKLRRADKDHVKYIDKFIVGYEKHYKNLR